MEKDTLKEFLEFPIWTSNDVFEKFKSIKGHIFRENPKNRLQRFLYIEGNRADKVLLVAHADTYFDNLYTFPNKEHVVVEENGYFISKDKKGNAMGLGADDRAGCAILWLLKDSGHSILITDGEEHGQIGTNWLMEENKDIADRINEHQFMLQFDRRNNADFKCYYVGTDEFRSFIHEQTGYTEPNRSSFTDICTLARDICGVNLSIGYYHEHSVNEKINISEWLNTFNISKNMLQKQLPRFKR